jgi:hypothetical protein
MEPGSEDVGGDGAELNREVKVIVLEYVRSEPTCRTPAGFTDQVFSFITGSSLTKSDILHLNSNR